VLARRSRPAHRSALAWRIGAGAFLALTVAGCSASTVSTPHVSPYVSHQSTQAEIKAADVALDRDRIMVQSGSLALPYQQLGVLEYSEPFSPRAIDEDHIDDRLRTMAIQKWGNDVDAIVGVKTTLSGDASEVDVSAQVVRVTGDCSFCRHAGGYPQGH
jgi:hypothetical protein